MNICIYTVHLFLYDCITCKVVWRVTVHSVTVVLPDVTMATVWMTVTVLKCRRLHFLCMPYFLSKVQFTHYCMWDIDWKRKMFELLRIWSISQFLAAPFSHCKAMIDNIISSDMRLCPWPLLPLPLFCLCTLPCILTPLLLSAVDRFLDVHPSSEFVTFVLSSVYICFPIEGSWNAPLSYFRERGLSLVDLYSLR